MTRLKRRRTFSLLALAVACCLYAWLHLSQSTRLLPAAHFSGIFLFALIVGLALFNARKKLPFIPLLKATTWMQLHIYLGFFSVAVFLFHTGFQWPNGGLETLVHALFLAVALSGILGLAISRIVPAILTAHGESIIFERIHGLRSQLRREIEQLIVDSETATRSSTIADFYSAQLADYFARPRHFWSHLIGSPRPLNNLLERIDALGRYLDAEEKKVVDQVADLVRAKENLDRQWHLQGLLKLWLFVHIPLSFALILFAATHGWIAWRFTA